VDYNAFVFRLQSAATVTAANTRFLDYLPNVIDLGEQRCYRELDLLGTVVRDTSSNATANARDFTLPQTLGRFVLVTGINIVTPVGSTVANGTRNRLTQLSLDALDALWPINTAASATTVPKSFAMVTDQTVAFGPSPGAAFQAEIIGPIRPTPLSPVNTTTYLTNFLPDLFFAACMVAVAGLQRDYGAQADDPKLATSWESQYQTFFASANIEEQRKRFASSGWQSAAPAPAAAQPR
jgi:hypothetical protein